MSEAASVGERQNQGCEHLAHHFDTPQQQFDAGKLGMWLFLTTELLLFSGLFCAYAVYRALHPEVFRYASQYLDMPSGLANTLILLTSGLTMALAVRFAQTGKKIGLAICLFLTICGGLGFLGLHGYEYFTNYRQKLLWGLDYNPTRGPHGKPLTPILSMMPPKVRAKPAESPGWTRLDQLGKVGFIVSHSDIAPASPGPSGAAPQEKIVAIASPYGQPANVQLFFSIYYLMTGLHSLHVLVGVILITWLLIRAIRGDFGPGYYTPVDLIGMYWGLVDMIWMFLFPLLYLIH
jgi:cytochrome c oxidase subunit 3